VIVKPNLLKLDWFARAWIRFVALRRRVGLGGFKSQFRTWIQVSKGA